MSEATISILKNHLPEFVHQAEKGEDIQITRHGKAVAVIVSLERYNQAFGSEKESSAHTLNGRSNTQRASVLQIKS